MSGWLHPQGLSIPTDEINKPQIDIINFTVLS